MSYREKKGLCVYVFFILQIQRQGDRTSPGSHRLCLSSCIIYHIICLIKVYDSEDGTEVPTFELWLPVVSSQQYWGLPPISEFPILRKDVERSNLKKIGHISTQKGYFKIYRVRTHWVNPTQPSVYQSLLEKGSKFDSYANLSNYQLKNYLSLKRFALKWDQVFNPKELNPYDDIWSIRGLLRIPTHSVPLQATFFTIPHISSL